VTYAKVAQAAAGFAFIFFETVTSGNVPIPDVTDLFDHIVSRGHHRWRSREAKGLCGFKIEDKLKLCRFGSALFLVSAALCLNLIA
jgi:hypothetical protein